MLFRHHRCCLHVLNAILVLKCCIRGYSDVWIAVSSAVPPFQGLLRRHKWCYNVSKAVPPSQVLLRRLKCCPAFLSAVPPFQVPFRRHKYGSAYLIACSARLKCCYNVSKAVPSSQISVPSFQMLPHLFNGCSDSSQLLLRLFECCSDVASKRLSPLLISAHPIPEECLQPPRPGTATTFNLSTQSRTFVL